MMHRSARFDAIMEALARSGSQSVADLTQKLSVSDETVRRDIKNLASKGLVERVHGGVVLPNRHIEDDFRRRIAQSAAEKEAIAELAAGEVRNGDTLMIDSGATTAYVAWALRGHRDLFVLTNSTEIARTLVGGPGNRVHVAGGEMRRDDNAVFGETAVAFFRQFRTRLAILSIGAIHPSGGFMDYHLQEAEVARCMVEQAETTMVVADYSKFSNLAPVSVCGFDAVGTLVCDRQPPEAICQLVRHHEGTILAGAREGDAQPES